jgi:hypothetical protein
MIRRVLSILLFVFGGWMLVSEIFIAFFDMEPGVGDNAMIVGIFATLAIIPLLLGAWASPERRWQELGLTILIAVGVGLICGVSMLVVLVDPGFKPFMPSMPKMQFAPVMGLVNALVVAAIGWLLYRGKRGGIRSKADPGSSAG